MKKLLLTILLVTIVNANEFRVNQVIDETDIYYKDIRYICLGGTLHFVKSSTYKNTIIQSVENPRTTQTYKCDLIANDMYTDKRQIIIKD